MASINSLGFHSNFFFLLVLVVVASFLLSSFVSLCQFLLFFILISIFIAFSSILHSTMCVRLDAVRFRLVVALVDVV